MQAYEVKLFCEGCGEYRYLELVEDEFEYVLEGDDMVKWSAEYKCPHCGGTIYSDEYYKFSFEKTKYVEE